MTKERHSEAKSHRVGRATLGTGVVTTAYRAVVALECVQCAGAIAPGALFSRQPRRTPCIPLCARRVRWLPIPSVSPASHCA